MEAAIAAATDRDDLSAFNQLVDTLENPYQYRKALALFATPPKPDQVVSKLFVAHDGFSSRRLHNSGNAKVVYGPLNPYNHATVNPLSPFGA